MKCYVALGEEQFSKLVRGEVIEHRAPNGDTVLVILSDLGYTHMLRHIFEAMNTQSEKLYDIAREVCHDMGMPWTDPRTGITHPPPEKETHHGNRTASHPPRRQEENH